MKYLSLIFSVTLVLSNLPTLANLPTLGITIKIVEPEDGEIFHYRNVSIHCVASACCRDRLVYWEWRWIWNNGSYSESGEIDSKTEYEFYINISLYPGWSIIEAIVKSSRDLIAIDNITIYYDGPLAITNGPYEGMAQEAIKFYGSAYGGSKPYSWLWNFGDGNISYERNASHIYNKPGKYNVSLTVTDSRGYKDTAYTWAFIDTDDLPPFVKIVSPLNGIYINGKKIFPSIKTIVIGKMSVRAEAFDNDTHISSVAFYFDGEEKANDTIPPYTWLINGSTGWHEIDAIAYDIAMNSAKDSTRLLLIIK